MVFWTGLVKRLKETVSKKYIDDNLNLKADKVNTYTKEQCDNKFGSYTYLNNNYYKKTDSDNRYYQKSQVYSKQESDSRYPTYNYMNNNYYNRTQSDDRYQLKGAGGDYYTKTESDNRYYTKEQSDDRFAKDFQFISLQTQVNQRVKLNDRDPQTVSDLWLSRNIVSYDNPNLLVNKRYVDENIKRLLLKGASSMSLVDWFESGGIRYVLYKIRKPAEIDSWGRLVGINYVSYENFGFMGFSHYIKNNELYMSFYLRAGTTHSAQSDIYLWYVNYPSTLYEEQAYIETPNLDLPKKPTPQT